MVLAMQEGVKGKGRVRRRREGDGERSFEDPRDESRVVLIVDAHGAQDVSRVVVRERSEGIGVHQSVKATRPRPGGVVMIQKLERPAAVLPAQSEGLRFAAHEKAEAAERRSLFVEPEEIEASDERHRGRAVGR